MKHIPVVVVGIFVILIGFYYMVHPAAFQGFNIGTNNAGSCYNKITRTPQIFCSRPKCKHPAVVTRWYVGIDTCPPMVVNLCQNCKKVPPWDEENDVIKEEKIKGSEEIV